MQEPENHRLDVVYHPHTNLLAQLVTYPVDITRDGAVVNTSNIPEGWIITGLSGVTFLNMFDDPIYPDVIHKSESAWFAKDNYVFNIHGVEMCISVSACFPEKLVEVEPSENINQMHNGPKTAQVNLILEPMRLPENRGNDELRRQLTIDGSVLVGETRFIEPHEQATIERVTATGVFEGTTLINDIQVVPVASDDARKARFRIDAAMDHTFITFDMDKQTYELEHGLIALRHDENISLIFHIHGKY
jgi:hypothetical protein